MVMLRIRYQLLFRIIFLASDAAGLGLDLREFVIANRSAKELFREGARRRSVGSEMNPQEYIILGIASSHAGRPSPYSTTKM